MYFASAKAEQFGGFAALTFKKSLKYGNNNDFPPFI